MLVFLSIMLFCVRMASVQTTCEMRARRLADIDDLPALRGVDGRTKRAKRLREIVAEISEPLGGYANLPEVTRVTVRNAAALILNSESMQERIARGEAIDGDVLVRTVATATRLLNALKRHATPTAKAPTLKDYLANRAVAA